MSRATIPPSYRGGAGPPVVCVHGISDTWKSFRRLTPLLEPHHEVFVPTLLGHFGGPALPPGGEPSPVAMADQLERDMDAAGLERAHLVGNSLGGWLVLELAARGRALSVVALAPTGGWELDSKALARTRRMFKQSAVMARLTAPVAPLAMRVPPLRWVGLREVVADPLAITAAEAADMVRGVAGCPVFLTHLDYTRREGFPPLGPIDVPVRVVWGRRDRVLPLADTAAGIRRMVPDAEWIELDGIGHLPQLEDPETVARLVLELTSRRSARDQPLAGETK